MARKTIISELCGQINKKRGLTYPAKNYLYFADIRGDGANKKRVYCIVNDGGGVTAVHNGKTYRETANNLREILKTGAQNDH